MYKYEVIDNVKDDKEVLEYCKNNNIELAFDGKTTTFISTKEKLENLHNEFFSEYSFEIKKA